MDKISENRAQALLYVIIFLLIVSLGVAGFYFVSYTYEKKNRKELETQLALVESEKHKLEIQIEEFSKEKSILEEKAKESDKLIPELQDKLNTETQAKELLMGEHESLQNEIAQLKQEKTNLRSSLNTKVQEITQLQSRLNNIILERDELRARIEQVAKSRENQGSEGESLEKIVVRPENIKRTKPPLSTQVILVNREYGFVVLNAGAPEGIELKDIFEIMHKDISLGFVRIEKIHDTISAADFLDGFKKEKVREGDRANRVN
jgi:predicted nuclease with TOPRIM domain